MGIFGCQLYYRGKQWPQTGSNLAYIKSVVFFSQSSCRVLKCNSDHLD